MAGVNPVSAARELAQDTKIGGVLDELLKATTTAGIAEKVGRGQSHRIVVNLGDSSARPGDLQKLLQQHPINGLQEIIVIDKQGGLHRIFP